MKKDTEAAESFARKRSLKRTILLTTGALIMALMIVSCSSGTLHPELTYSTYFGGNGVNGTNNWLKHFSSSRSGSVYFATSAYNDSLPVTINAYDKTYNGGNNWGEEDLAIVEFNIKENALLYLSYFGGESGPEFISQVVRKGNSLYLAGNTGSIDFPTTTNAYDSTFNGPEFRHSDAFIARFDDNKLVYSSYIGTSGTDWAQNIFINDNNEIILVGLFKNFNELPNLLSFVEYDEKRQGYAGVIRFDATGDSILSTTILAPSWYLESCMDDKGNIYIASQTPGNNAPTTDGSYDTSFNGGDNNWGGDILITKLNPTADKILFSTFLGGSDDEKTPLICLDNDNNILIYAITNSSDFPLTADAVDKSFDGKAEPFLAKLSNDGKQLLYSSYFGGNEELGEINASLAVSGKGDVYLCGVTDAADYPITGNALQDTVNGPIDIFITVLDPALSGYKFSTFLGGSKGETARIKLDRSANIIGVGITTSPDFITTQGAYQTSLKGGADNVIFKISF